MAGFRWLLAAEWTKLWSVRRWTLAMMGMVALTVAFGVLASMGSGTDANRQPDFVVSPDGQPVDDEFHFVHWRMSGDGSVTARVLTQANSHPSAGAGVMIKQSAASGSAYAAAMVTPGHGVRMSANFDTDLAGPAGSTPRWLRLTRAGNSVTGYESTDGASWRPIGTVAIAGLPQTVAAGMFVSSPPEIKVERSVGTTSAGGQHTLGSATFDNVRVEPVQASQASWSSVDVRRRPAGAPDPDGGVPGAPSTFDGQVSEADGVFTVSGSGKIGPQAPDDDVVQIALFGVLVGITASITVGVLFMTSEYRRGMIRTTLAAHPSRVQVLAAKAIVLGGSVYALGLVAAAVALLAAEPILRRRGFAPPAFPPISLSDGPVLRALLGTAAFVALTAVLGLALGTVLRHGAAAITAAILLVTVPAFAAMMLPATAAEWLLRTTPTGGLAAQRAKPPTPALVEPWAMLSPWAGLGVAGAYAVVGLLGAAWLLRRRDA